MKKFKMVALVLALVFTLSACGSNMVLSDKGVTKEYGTIGLFNMAVDDDSVIEMKYPNIQYRIIWGNVIWGVILSETLIFPVYFFGFSCLEPVGLKAVK